MGNYSHFVFCLLLFGVAAGALTYGVMSGLILYAAISAGLASVSGVLAILGALRLAVWGNKP